MTIGTVATWFFLWIAVSVVFGLGLGQWMQTQAELHDDDLMQEGNTRR